MENDDNSGLKQQDEEDIRHLYNWAIKCLVKQAGGEMFVRLDDVESGYILYKYENHGVRFKFLSQG